MTFEKGVEIVFKWIAMFSTIGEWCVILLRELLKTLPRAEAQQQLMVIQLETCLALPFHSEPMMEEDVPPQDPWDDFSVLPISPDTFESWLRACESAAGVGEKNISLGEVIVLQDTIVVPPADSTGVLPSPKEKKAYVPKPRKKPAVKTPSAKKGFG